MGPDRELCRFMPKTPQFVLWWARKRFGQNDHNGKLASPVQGAGTERGHRRRADTFRAPRSEQLQVWGEPRPMWPVADGWGARGSDPASLAF